MKNIRQISRALPKTFKRKAKKQNPPAFKTALKYAVYFAAMLLLCLGRVNGDIRPFGYGFFLALVFTGESVLILAPLYIAAGLVADPSLNGLISVSAGAVTLIIATAVHFKLKKPIKLPLLFLYALIGQAGYIYICFAAKTNIINAVLTLLFSLLFMYVCVNFLAAALLRGLKYKLNRSELACMGIAVCAAACGLINIPVIGEAAFKAAAAFTVLLAVLSPGTAYAACAALCLAAGAALGGGSLAYFAPLLMIAVVSGIFTTSNKWLAAAAAFLCDIIAGFYFGAYGAGFGVLQIASCAGGLILAAALPRSVYVSLEDALLGAKEKTAVRALIARTRAETAGRLTEISGIFGEMQEAFKGMARGQQPGSPEQIAENTAAAACPDCKNSASCHGDFKTETLTALTETASAALHRGAAGILDLPPFLTSRCCRINAVLSACNSLAEEHRKIRLIGENRDASRLLIGEQLGGAGKIISALAADLKKGVSFNADRERRIIEELTYASVICSEALVTESGGVFAGAALTVKTASADRSAILKTVSAVCRCAAALESAEDSSRPGWSIFTLRPAARFDVTFGAASCCKLGSESSGDAHSFIKVSDEKFMIALSDGMGSGEQARRLSSTALSLIESFYKAGFENDLILGSVNKLLALNSEESFSALDICVIDLMSGAADLIKIGSPYGFIKRRSETEISGGGALPLGVLEEIRPAVQKTLLTHGDMLVLCTDGVTDLFSREELQSAVNNIRTANPQILAEELLKLAYAADRSAPHDDMSVICARMIRVC